MKAIAIIVILTIVGVMGVMGFNAGKQVVEAQRNTTVNYLSALD